MTTGSTTGAEGAYYRFDRPTFSVIMRDLRFPGGDLGPGDRIPQIDLPTTEGGRFSTDSVLADGRPVLLVFGSLTCPATESSGPELRDLYRGYSNAIRFVMVNVREAHPGADTPQPQTIDDIDGTVHRAFGTRPSSAYIIDPGGTIVFRAHWSNRRKPLEDALRAVIQGRSPQRPTVAQTIRALTGIAVYADVALDAAGRGPLRDFWWAAPPVAAMITLSRLFRFLPTERRAAPTVAATLALCAVAVAGGWPALR